MNHRSIIVKTIALVLAALVISGCGGAEGRKAKYLEKGKNYFAEEKYDKALVEFKNVLQIDPKFAEGYFYIGRVEEARRNYQQAFGNYSKAVELNPDHFEARLRLGRFYTLARDLPKAKEQINLVLAKNPTHSGARILMATIASGEGKDDEAIKAATDIIKSTPSEFDAYSLLAAVYSKKKQPDKSIEILQQAITAHPKNIPLRMNLIQIYRDLKDIKKVEELLRECIDIEPDKFQHRVNLFAFLADTNQPDKAEKELRASIKQDPDDEKWHMLLAEFLFNKVDKKVAEQELLKAIKDLPKSSTLRFGLANFHEMTDNTPKAIDIYREIVSIYDVKPEGLRARNSLAGLLLRQDKQEEAEKLTDEVLQENSSNNDALMTKARLLLARRDAPGAIAALRTVLRDQPNLVDAYLYMADAHALNKEPVLAKENIEKAIDSNPKNVKAHLALAKFYVHAGDMGAAIKKVDGTLKLSPDDHEVLIAKYEILAAKKDIAGVRAVLEKIKAVKPDNPFSYYQLGQLYASQRKYDAALREYEQALLKSENKFLPMTGIVNVYLGQKKPEKAHERLNQALEKDPSSLPYVHELVAEVYITQKKYDEAERSLRMAIEVNPEWNVTYRNLASIYLVRGDSSTAIQIYQQGLQAIPGDPLLMRYLAESYERSRDYAKAISTYEQILSKHPENDVVANNLASLLLDHKTDAASLKRARELVARFETTSQMAFMDTLGWMHYRSGETDKAIALLEEVVKRTPTVPIFRYHLGMAYFKKGDLQVAKSHLAKAVEVKSEYPGLEEARETLKKIP